MRGEHETPNESSSSTAKRIFPNYQRQSSKPSGVFSRCHCCKRLYPGLSLTLKDYTYRIHTGMQKSLLFTVLCLTAFQYGVVSSLSSPPASPGGHNGSTARRLFLASAPAALIAAASPAHANNNQRSRSEDYAVQKSDSEWHSILSPTQYNILREGGTERPNDSILESEERSGVYSCAGCGTDLFESSQKFHSGTGWVSNCTDE